MKNRFDLEEEISSLYNFAEQLGIISQGIVENDLNRDEIVSAIEGIRVILNLHAKKLHNTMCQCFSLEQLQK